MIGKLIRPYLIAIGAALTLGGGAVLVLLNSDPLMKLFGIDLTQEEPQVVVRDATTILGELRNKQFYVVNEQQIEEVVPAEATNKLGGLNLPFIPTVGSYLNYHAHATVEVGYDLTKLRLPDIQQSATGETVVTLPPPEVRVKLNPQESKLIGHAIYQYGAELMPEELLVKVQQEIVPRFEQEACASGIRERANADAQQKFDWAEVRVITTPPLPCNAQPGTLSSP